MVVNEVIADVKVVDEAVVDATDASVGIESSTSARGVLAMTRDDLVLAVTVPGVTDVSVEGRLLLNT